MRTKKFVHAWLRATVGTVALFGIVSCTARLDASAVARREYVWALQHGGCDCGPVAFPPKSASPSWVDGLSLAGYVHDKAIQCGSRPFIVASFGDGDGDISGDMNLARARAAPFVRRASEVKHGHVDTIILGGPHIAHPSTLAIMCPTERLPAKETF